MADRWPSEDARNMIHQSEFESLLGELRRNQNDVPEGIRGVVSQLVNHPHLNRMRDQREVPAAPTTQNTIPEMTVQEEMRRVFTPTGGRGFLRGASRYASTRSRVTHARAPQVAPLSRQPTQKRVRTITKNVILLSQGMVTVPTKKDELYANGRVINCLQISSALSAEEMEALIENAFMDKFATSLPRPRFIYMKATRNRVFIPKTQPHVKWNGEMVLSICGNGNLYICATGPLEDGFDASMYIDTLQDQDDLDVSDSDLPEINITSRNAHQNNDVIDRTSLPERTRRFPQVTVGTTTVNPNTAIAGAPVSADTVMVGSDESVSVGTQSSVSPPRTSTPFPLRCSLVHNLATVIEGSSASVSTGMDNGVSDDLIAADTNFMGGNRNHVDESRTSTPACTTFSSRLVKQSLSFLEHPSDLATFYEENELVCQESLNESNDSSASDIITLNLGPTTKELLAGIVIQAHDPGCLRILVRRGHVLEDVLQRLQRCEVNQLNKPLKVVFVGEDAEDEGGPTREMFSIFLQELAASSFMHGQTLSHNGEYRMKKMYRAIGWAMVLSLVRGGPAPRVFSPGVVRYLMGLSPQTGMDDLGTLKGNMQKLMDMTTTYIQLNIDDLLENRFQMGFSRPTCQVSREDLPTILKIVSFNVAIESCHSELQQLIEGLQVFGFLNLARSHPHSMSNLFETECIKSLTADMLQDILQKSYSEPGTTAREKEEAIVIAFNNLLMDVECE